MEHPGRTPAQREVLDQIGHGNNQELLELRLIEPSGYVMVGYGDLTVSVPLFDMPVCCYEAWCAAMGKEFS